MPRSLTSGPTKVNSLCSSRQSAITLINNLYSMEKTNMLYHKVLAHKVGDGWLKKLFSERLLPSIQKKKDALYLIIRLMDLNHREANTLGINGIMSECFQEIEDMANEDRVDEIILQTLVSLLHYELGNYRMLLSYLRNIDIDFKVGVVKEIIRREEYNLHLLLEALKAE